MKRIFAIISILLLLLCNSAPAGTKKDSLESIVRNSKGAQKIEACLELAYMSRVNNFSSSHYYASEALEESRRISDTIQEAYALYYLGMAYYYYSEIDTAMQLFSEAAVIAGERDDNKLLGNIYHLMGTANNVYYGNIEKTFEYYNQSIHHSMLAENPRALGAVYSSLSNIFRGNGSYEKALEYIYRANEYYHRAGYKEGEAWINYLTGILYNSVGLYEESLQSLQRSLEQYTAIAEENGNMNGIAICLDQLASVNRKLGNLELARDYSHRALDLHLQGDSKFGISTSLKYLADIEFTAGNHKTALSYLDSSLSIKKASNDLMGFASVYELYGRVFSRAGQYRRAIDSLQLGMQHALQHDQLRHLMDINGHLSKIYYELNDFDKAYYYQSEQTKTADSLYNTKVTRNMLQLETLYETEKRKARIHKLEQDKRITELLLAREKQFRYYLIGILGLSLIIIILFAFLYRIKIRTNQTLKESKRIVDETNATKDKFFSIIAHDLRSPFNSILGLTGILKDKIDDLDNKEMKKITGALYDSSRKSYELLNNLLEWSSTQSGRISFSPENIQFDNILQDVLGLLSNNAEQKNINIINASGSLTVFADRNMLHTVLRNLISNAIKYSYPGGNIRIGSEKKENEVILSVSDSGIGIPESQKKRLFHITDGYTINGTSGEKGSGLGLIICKEFVEKHGGRIWVESESGKGTTFYFTLPAEKK